MSNYTNLKNAIQSVIKANGNNEITGPILQAELLSMITTLGAGYQYMGVAQPSTNPGTPDARVMYLAYLPGTYVNFGGLTVTGFCVLKYDTVWTKEDIPISGGGGGADFVTEPDDLTLVSGTPNKLKFADRAYNSQNPNGMGYKILRKDLTFAEQVTEANTIYEIRYDFDLNNGTLTFPNNCVLYFKGGKISNGNIVFNNTLLIGKYVMDDIVSMTGSLQNHYIDTANISFTSDERELYYIIKLKINYTRFKAGKTYQIPANPAVYDANNGRTFIREDNGFENIILDFNNSTIEDSRSGENIGFLSCRGRNKGIGIYNLTYTATVPYSDDGGVNNRGIYCFGAYPYGFTDTKVKKCKFINVAVPFESECIYEDSKNCNIELEYDCTGLNDNAGSFRYLAVIWSCTNIVANISAKNIRTHRIIFNEGNKQATYNFNIEDITITAAGLWLQEHLNYKTIGSSEYYFSHNENISAIINLKGSLTGILVGVGHYTSDADGESAFAYRKSNVYIPNIDVTIIGDGVTVDQATPHYFFECLLNSRSKDENGEYMDIRFYLDLKMKILLKNDPGITGNIFTINSDASGVFGGLCAKADVEFISDKETVGERIFNVRYLDENSHLKFKDKSKAGYSYIRSDTYVDYKPVIELIGCKGTARPLLPDGTKVGRYIFNNSYGIPSIGANASIDDLLEKQSINDEIVSLTTNQWLQSLRHFAQVIIGDSITTNFDSVVTNLAYNCDYCVIMRNNTTVNQRVISITSTYSNIPKAIVINAGSFVICHYGKVNGIPYLYYISNTPQINGGASNYRPVLQANAAGVLFYDTTLKKVILWNGTAWVNVDGSVLS